MDEKHSDEKLAKVTRGNKITIKVAPYYVHLSNSYAKLAELLADPDPPPEDNTKQTATKQPETKTTPKPRAIKHQSNFKIKAARFLQSKLSTYMSKMNDYGIINLYITKAEDERTTIKKKTSRLRGAPPQTPSTRTTTKSNQTSATTVSQ